MSEQSGVDCIALLGRTCRSPGLESWWSNAFLLFRSQTHLVLPALSEQLPRGPVTLGANHTEGCLEFPPEETTFSGSNPDMAGLWVSWSSLPAPQILGEGKMFPSIILKFPLLESGGYSSAWPKLIFQGKFRGEKRKQSTPQFHLLLFSSS